MKIGYCSPFNPMKSGISDFSEELVFALAKHAEIVIFSPVIPEKKDILETFEVHPLSDLDKPEIRDSLDHIVYHVGNNIHYHGAIVEMLEKYPGIVELHELGLHHLAAARTLEARGKEAYLDMVRYCHGERGVKIAQAFFDGNAGAPWNDHALDMCMARPYIEQATGVIVHAEMIKQMVLGIRPQVPVVNIILHSLDITDEPEELRRRCREVLGLPQEKLILGSFGFATSAKRILPTLDALARLKESGQDFLYVLVGEVEKGISIKKELESRNLTDRVTVTGFATLDDFKHYLGACDLCLNLRYPTQWESSASLHRMLGMGKPAVVTDVGTFADYPDDVVLKVRHDQHEVEDIYQALIQLTKKKDELRRRSAASIQFAKEHCDLLKNAEMYAEFFQQVKDGTWQADYEDELITRLCEAGLTEEDYLRHVFEESKPLLANA